MKSRCQSRTFHVAALALCLMSLVAAPQLRSANEEQVRAPAVANSFYPGDPQQLEKTVDELLARAGSPATQEPLVALVAPHAGYPFSGGIAALSFAQLKGRKFERVVVIAPSHFEGFAFTSVYEGDAYATPLGTIPVDKAFAARLAALDPGIQLSSRGHTPAGAQGEHSLEVELPFLQRTLGKFHLVPIVMGDQSYKSSRALGVALAKLLQGTEGTLIVASSDLSHYHTGDQASAMDHKTLQAIEDWDTLNLSGNFEARVWEACGGAPIVAAMIAAQRLGATEARVLKYANSGDVTGDRSRVVGYGAVALVRASRSPHAAGGGFTLTSSEKQELLRIARQAAETAVKEKKLYEPPAPASPALLQERGAFVTLRIAGALRGCIGYTAAVKPLYLTVRDVAVWAALRDARYPPVSLSELGQLDYEVSVLSPFRQVLDVKQIQVGRDGLLLRQGDKDGVLLPQVPVEQGWDRNTFLEQASVKAGLPPAAWKDAATDIFAFTALVFEEPKAPHTLLPEPPPDVRPPGPPEAGSPPR